MDYLFVVRILIALFIGFWLARHFRVHIRSLVVRLMPLKYRMSERSFYLQTKISTTLGFLIALGVGFIVNEAMSRGLNILNKPWFSRNEQAVVITPPPVQEVQNNSIAAIEKDSVPNAYATPISIEEPVEPQAFTENEAKIPAISTTISDHYYLQLSAYDNPRYAKAYFNKIQRRFPETTHMGKTAEQVCPYKILLGPFPGRKASIQFKVKHQLDGFPRKIEPYFLVQ
jgi:hypothetical protein